MKKIKFLILALLGITIIPTATNALNTTNYTKVYRQCLGRSDDWMLDKSQPRIYCADTSYNSANRFIPYGANGLNSFKANRNLYWNGTYYNSSVYSKGQLLDTVGYFYFGYDKNPQKEKIDVSEFTINLPKNGLVNFFRFGKSKDYTDFLPNRFGLTLLDTTVVSDWKVATSVGGTMLYGKYIAYENNKLVVYDFENKIRYVWGKIDNLEVDHIHGGYAVLRAIKNQKPEEVYRVEFASSNAAGYIPVFSESWQSDLVYGYKMVEILEGKMVSEYDGNPQIGGGSQNIENSHENYNQCSSYWSDIKNLAYYSQKCGDDVSDEQTQNWVKVDSWNAEGNLPEFSEGANKNKCGRFANAKKKYKEKYKENWEKFYADFSTYARTPESVSVEALCRGVNNLGFFDGLKGVLGTIGNNVAMFDNQSQIEFERDFGRYITFKNACRDGDFMPTPLDKWYESLNQINPLNWIFGSSNNNENVCKYVEKLESDLISKYGNLVFTPEYRKKVEFDLKGNIFSQSGSLSLNEVQEVVKNLPSNPLHDKFQNEEGLVKFLKKDYQLGVNQAYSIFSSIQCGRGIGIKEWDYLVYLPLVLFCVRLLRGKF